MNKIVSNNAQAGIYSLLDTHQDCFSSKFCLYDGMTFNYDKDIYHCKIYDVLSMRY
jgi:hypothetical protein